MPVEPIVMRPHRPPAAWQFRAYGLIAPRLPLWALRLLGRLALRLPRGSRARRWLVLGFAQIVWDATARSRDDLYLPAWDPACEWRWEAEFQSLGFDELYRGHEGVIRSVETWNEIWTDIVFSVREILDGGDAVAMRMTLAGKGARSGAPVHMEFTSVAHLDPLIVQYQNFLDDADALRDAGLAP